MHFNASSDQLLHIEEKHGRKIKRNLRGRAYWYELIYEYQEDKNVAVQESGVIFTIGINYGNCNAMWPRDQIQRRVHTSKSQWNCLTASAVPRNHLFPASPGVWVAAKTCVTIYQPWCCQFHQNLKLYWKIKIGVYLDIAISECDTIAKVVSPSNMSVKRGRVELGENVNFVDATVDTVAHWYIN